MLIKGNIDIIVITETKIDESFPSLQFAIEGYAPPFRLYRNVNGGGVIIYVREDIPCRELKTHGVEKSFEGIFLEINLRKSKWLLFGGYNYNKGNIDTFLGNLGPMLDFHMTTLENFLILGDFNSEMDEASMMEFCNTYNLKDLINEPTCYKNPLNPSSIDLILTNKFRSFQNSLTLETGLSDHHKLTTTVMRLFFPKQAPLHIIYSDFKNYDHTIFRNELENNLGKMEVSKTYENFESIFMKQLNKYAPMKEKYVRANNAPFMNKALCKAIMNRSRARNKYLKLPNEINRASYKKQRNYCLNLLRKEKKKYYRNLNVNKIIDNKQFWKTMKPFFSDKSKLNRDITLIDGENIITSETEIAETMNTFFSNAVQKLDIQGYQTNFSLDINLDKITNTVNKFKNHPSIIKIKENRQGSEKFSFSYTNNIDIASKLNQLNTSKPTTLNNIPVKILVETNDICSHFISKFFNDAVVNSTFPATLKMAEITPAHKKDETTLKENYRPISILPSVSKIFERTMYDHIYEYMGTKLSHYLCGFRKGYSTQYCLIAMLEQWKKALDKHNIAGALLTDLSKAFDCLNHELLIAKLEAYGFDNAALAFISSYLSGRKQRTKVKNHFSQWSDILSGIPQGSILGPLLFNIYMNDIFYFVNEKFFANYADDNTPYAIDKDIEEVLNILKKDTTTLIEWFNYNYFKMNADKCKLLITNHNENASISIQGEIISASNCVKLLGINIDNKLDYKEHISSICKKASLKLHALARISHFMNEHKLRILMKAFIESQFGYCPLIWMFHSRTSNNKINKLHERALRLVYKDYNSSFQELLNRDDSFSIHHRNLQKLATEMYKVKNDLSPSFMKMIFPLSNNTYLLRNDKEFKTNNFRTVSYGSETITYRGPKTWELVPSNIKSSNSLNEFKEKIKHWKPEGCMCRICKTYISNLGFI